MSDGVREGVSVHPAIQRLRECEAYALTPNTVEQIPNLGALFLRGGPVQDPVLTVRVDRHGVGGVRCRI